MSCQYLASGEKVCCHDREVTEHTHGVWTSCDNCGHDWWCIGVDRDYMDEPTRYVCSDGCEDDDWDDDWDDDTEEVQG